MITYQFLLETDIDVPLFAHFTRQQQVELCRRKVNGTWQELHDPFVDDWSAADYQTLVLDLQGVAARGGIVIGAFAGEELKGFVAVDIERFGRNREYLDLPCIHVSADMRGQGIGRALFTLAKDWAEAQGAQKLYISAHSAVESQAFYQAMGCVEAAEYSAEHVEKEPMDCQLEYRL